MVGQSMRFAAALAVALCCVVEATQAHSWYPPECCHDIDCAPVDQIVRLVPDDGGPAYLRVTSKHGTVTIPAGFPSRESHDSRVHVCIGYDAFGNRDVLCYFLPPGM